MKHETINDLLCLAYWLGVVISYHLGRYAIRKYTTLKWNWRNILLTAGASTCSILTVLIFLEIIALEEISAYFRVHKFPDPPTWL